jgi:tRNA 2-(methylsulfanyl)-N6-isopentenyladenosine37 hydroxylase
MNDAAPVDTAEAAEVLAARTPAAWVEDALACLPELLRDHASCEKKAASSALALMFAYPGDRAFALALARLAREELRHFERVVRAMEALGVTQLRQRPGGYAQALRAALRASEPGRKLDLLIANALIEARSLERFRLLAPRLPGPLGQLYAELGAAEARHAGLYFGFARDHAPREWRRRLGELAAHEAQLATTPGPVLRFHSGPLARAGRGLS